MGKHSGYLERLAVKQAARDRETRIFALQQAKDMMLIAAHTEFGFGPDRCKRLGDAFDRTFSQYADITLEDAKTDKDIWHTKERVDGALRAACGENFVPWEERYGG